MQPYIKDTKWCIHFEKPSVRVFGFLFLTKINVFLSYDLAITLLDIYPIELKFYIHRKTYIQILTAALFIIAQNWRERRCP